MKLGIKEFRERIAELADGDEVVQLTKHGRQVGEYRPRRKFDAAAAEAARRSVEQWQAELRARGIEPEDLLADLGLDALGHPLQER